MSLMPLLRWSPPTAGHAAAVGLAQQANELAAQLAARHGVDGAVDGLVRDAQRTPFRVVGLGIGHAAQSARNLLGRPVGRQQVAHRAPARQVRVAAQLAARQACSSPALVAHALPMQRVVGHTAGLALATRELAADGGMVKPQPATNGPGAQALGVQGGNLMAVGYRQVRVVRSHGGITLPDAGCRTSRLSRPLLARKIRPQGRNLLAGLDAPPILFPRVLPRITLDPTRCGNK